MARTEPIRRQTAQDSPQCPDFLRKSVDRGPEDGPFAAGAALSLLNVPAKETAPPAQVWRRRLAVRAAVASTRGLEPAELRDAWCLTLAGADHGPAGRVYSAWRALSDPVGRRPAAEIAVGFEVSPFVATEILAALDDLAATGAPPLDAAGVAWTRAIVLGAGRACAAWAADRALATALGWGSAIPLLATSPGFRALPDRLQPAALAAVYAAAAVRALDLHRDLARRAAKLMETADKLRGRDAKALISAFLAEDAVYPAAHVAKGSDRGTRRTCERLVALGALRELTGRSSSRLYGL